MTKRPLIIGLTGNIGVGKSAALAALQRLGAHIIDADKVAHQVMQPGGQAYQGVIDAFGPGILARDQSIDRAKLAQIVFSDAGQLARLEAIVHPAVAQAVRDEIASTSEDVVVIEAIKLLEGRLRSICDEIWVVTAPEPVQLARLRQSRGMTEAAARGRLAAQSSQAWKISQADVVIPNDSDLATLEERIAAAWKRRITK